MVHITKKKDQSRHNGVPEKCQKSTRMLVIKARTSCEHPKNKPRGQCGLYSHFQVFACKFPQHRQHHVGMWVWTKIALALWPKKKHEEKKPTPHKPLTPTGTPTQPSKLFSFQHQANKTVLTFTGKPWVVVGGAFCFSCQLSDMSHVVRFLGDM